MSVPPDAQPFLDVPDPLGPGRAGAPAAADARPPAEPSLTRADRRTRLALALALALAWLAALTLGIGPRADLVTPSGALSVLGPLAAAALGLSLARRRDARGLPGPLLPLQVALVCAPLVFGLAVWPAVHGGEAPFDASREAVCFGLTALLMVGPLGWVAAQMRGALPTAPGLRGAALGLAVGLSAVAAIQVVCPHGAVAHLALGHGAPLLLAAAVGALAGRLGGRP